MALKATIHKVQLQIADMDRHYYADHALTVAQHPSETDERMMVRLLAFALNADASLTFGRGVSTEGEPDLWRKDLTDAIEVWIQLGQPDESSRRGSRLPRPLTPPGIRFRTTAVHEERLSPLTVSSIQINPR